MENKMFVSKNDRSKWPARPEFDWSSPRSGRTLSVDRPLFSALGASERFENKQYSRACHVNKVFPGHTKKLVLLLLPHVICHALSEVKHTSITGRYWLVNLKIRKRKTDNDCSVTTAVIKRKCLSTRSPCTCIYLGFLSPPPTPSTTLLPTGKST